MSLDNPPPEEDSEDLTDEHISQAEPTQGPADLTARLVSLSKCSCGERIGVMGHSLRRRIPHLYSVTKFTCSQGHETTLVFGVDWLKPTW